MNKTKLAILNVSIQMFSNQGYNGVSMRNIADAVKISPPALYNHFADKKSLYEAAVAHNFASKTELLQPVLKQKEPSIIRLQKFIDLLSHQINDDGEFSRLIQWELLNEDEGRLQYLAQDLFAPLFDGLMDLLKELKPEIDAHLLAIMIIGMIQKPYEMKPLATFLSDNQSTHQDPSYLAQQVMNILKPFFGE